MANPQKKTERPEEQRPLSVPDALAGYVKAERDFLQSRMVTFNNSVRQQAQSVVAAADALLAALGAGGAGDAPKEGDA
jgi:hypothetical protein